MRLFISVSFDDDVKDSLYKHMCLLTKECDEGVFTKRENIHLTLVFIGETNQIGSIVETMDALDFEEFRIALSDDGNFKRSGGDIYWLGIEKSPELVRLQKILYRSLVRSGVISEKNDFRPHLTVSRETVVGRDAVPDALYTGTIPVRRISLVKAEDVRGEGPVYTEVYAKDLRPAKDLF